MYLQNISYYVKEHIFLLQITPDSQEHGLVPLVGPESIRHLCYQEARELVETQIDSRSGNHPNITSSPILSLVTGLTSLMLQIKVCHNPLSIAGVLLYSVEQCLAESERNAYELQALHDTLEDLRSSLDKSNLTALRNHVLVHVQHIQSGLPIR